MSHLSKSQLLVLKAAIVAETDPVFAGYRQRVPMDKSSMATWYKSPSTIVVWRTAVSKKDVIANVAFDWTRVDNLTAGKARIWGEMFSVGDIDASQANIRAGIDAAWVGTAADLAVRASIYTKCKRFASRLEKLYATGTGTDVAPAVMGFEGTIDSGDIDEALEAV